MCIQGKSPFASAGCLNVGLEALSLAPTHDFQLSNTPTLRVVIQRNLIIIPYHTNSLTIRGHFWPDHGLHNDTRTYGRVPTDVRVFILKPSSIEVLVSGGDNYIPNKWLP